jgi:hypothetical protein
MATMGVDTATIRVARRTRDVLAGQARERGISLAALLAEVAREREVEMIWQSERDASRADAKHPEVAHEERAWEAATADGLD